MKRKDQPIWDNFIYWPKDIWGDGQKKIYRRDSEYPSESNKIGHKREKILHSS